jgi:hypothetical protein
LWEAFDRSRLRAWEFGALATIKYQTFANWVAWRK